MAQRSGVVTEILLGADRKGKATVGGKVVNFWIKRYGVEEDSLVHEQLRQAERDGLFVICDGDEWMPAGRDKPSFTAETVTFSTPGAVVSASPVSNGAQNGSQGQEQGKEFVGRTPGEWDRWEASMKALQMVADMEAAGVKVDPDFAKLPLVERAWVWLGWSQELADRLGKVDGAPF